MGSMSIETNSRLTRWVRSVLGDVAVAHDPPGKGQEETAPAVNLYMLRLGEGKAVAQSQSAFQITLHYLVTTRAEDLQRAQQMLLDLAFSAMESADYDLDLNAMPLTAWHQFNLPPRPSFVLQVPLEKPRPARRVKPVSETVLEQAPLGPLSGRVVYGPQDSAMPNVQVELPTLGRSTRTDQDGWFRFGAVPAGQKVKFRIRGQEFSPVADGQPLVFHLEPNGGVTCQPT